MQMYILSLLFPCFFACTSTNRIPYIFQEWRFGIFSLKHFAGSGFCELFRRSCESSESCNISNLSFCSKRLYRNIKNMEVSPNKLTIARKSKWLIKSTWEKFLNIRKFLSKSCRFDQSFWFFGTDYSDYRFCYSFYDFLLAQEK